MLYPQPFIVLMHCEEKLSIENIVHTEPSEDPRVIELHRGVVVRETAHNIYYMIM